MTLNLALILIAQLTLTYLIYRYARYSPWRSKPIGRAYMMMKTALWAMLSFVVLVRLLPTFPGREGVVVLLLLYMTAAIVVQTVLIVKMQGGLRRRRKVSDAEYDRV